MKEIILGVTPKTQRAAYNRAATLMIQLEDQRRKRENVMNSASQTSQKLEQLRKTQSELEEQARMLEASEQVTQKQIEDLSAAHNLNEIETLETKQRLLSKQIARLERQGKQ